MSKRATTAPADEPDQAPPAAESRQQLQQPVFVEQVPSTMNGISALGSANAPMVYFDGVPFHAYGHGVGCLTLTATRQVAQVGAQAVEDRIITGLLRAPLPALLLLRESINSIEEMFNRQAATAAAQMEPPSGMAH